MTDFLESTAEFSVGGREAALYRWFLSRIWDRGRPLLHIIGLNPSTADDRKSDPTVTREMARAQAMGFGGLLKTNAYAWRSTDRTALYTLADPVGHSCDDWIRAACRRSQQTIVAWGADCPRVMANRPREILSILSDERVMPYAFKVVGKGQPGHPLYLPYSLQPRPLWELLSE